MTLVFPRREAEAQGVRRQQLLATLADQPPGHLAGSRCAQRQRLAAALGHVPGPQDVQRSAAWVALDVRAQVGIARHDLGEPLLCAPFAV